MLRLRSGHCGLEWKVNYLIRVFICVVRADSDGNFPQGFTKLLNNVVVARIFLLGIEIKMSEENYSIKKDIRIIIPKNLDAMEFAHLLSL